jgi:hypothetical protein
VSSLRGHKFLTSKFIFIIDTGGHIDIKDGDDMNESITANSIHIQR